MKRTKLKDRLLPDYTRGEEIFNMVTHIVGGGFGVIALATCVVKAFLVGNAYDIVSAFIYGFAMIILYTMSSVYHGLIPPLAKKVMQILDHCAIYFLITGSYAPLLCRVSPDLTGVIIFSLLTGLSLVGCTGHFCNIRSFKKFEIILYIAMGWCCIAIAGKLFRMLPAASLWMLAAGGVCYTVGVVFYVNRREFSHAIWHLFVSAGAALQFFAITGMMNL